SMMLSLIAFAIAFRYIPLDRLGMRVEFDALLVLRAGLLMAPLVISFAALQTVVAAYARSYREAQTYLSLLMRLPMIPSVVVMALARGEEIGLARYALSFGTSLALAGVLVWIAVRIYHREQLAVSA